MGMKLAFCLTLLCSTWSFSQELLTRGEAFNFDVGDEFHISSMTGNPYKHVERITILDKFYSDSGHIVNYVSNIDAYTFSFNPYPPLNPHYSFTLKIDTISYSKLDSVVFVWNNFDYYGDTSIYVSQPLCDSIVQLFTTFSSPFEPSVSVSAYSKGLGLVESSYYYTENSSYAFQDVLIYYKKQSGTCGIPDKTTLGQIDLEAEQDELALFPNPSNAFISLKLPENFGALKEIRIYDKLGKEVLKSTISQDIDVRSLDQGMYVLVAESAKGRRLLSKFVKE